MKRVGFSSRILCGIFYVAFLGFLPLCVAGQPQNMIINLAPIDGVPITPDNIFSYHVQCARPGPGQVKGTIHYRNSNLSLSYSFSYNFRQGLNVLTAEYVHPQWQFSSSALQELFMSYKVLPEGTLEYCVTITPGNTVKEANGLLFDECLYYKPGDIFLINLIDPEDKAKLKEYNPMLSWIANYVFASELTYRVRVAEMKQGQTPVTAVMRNQPVYDENNLMQNSIVYPISAKPLLPNQPYAWTVDAYYKGILLGGAETWQFIIPDDTLADVKPPNRSYIDIKKEDGTAKLYIMDEMKIKYLLDKYRTDELSLQLLNSSKQDIAIKPQKLKAVYGDNRYILNLKDSCNLKHLNDYTLIVKTAKGESYSLPFRYIKAEFAH